VLPIPKPFDNYVEGCLFLFLEGKPQDEKTRAKKTNSKELKSFANGKEKSSNFKI